MSHIIRIPVSSLEVGMYICDVNNPWVPDNNLAKQGYIRNNKVIDQIVNLGVTEVFIDTEKGKAAPGKAQDQIVQEQQVALQSILEAPYLRPEAKVDFDEEYDNALQIQAEATELVAKVMQDIKIGKPADISSAEQSAGAIIESLGNNQNALLCVTQLRTKDRYLLEHSFNVSVLMGILASSLDYSGKRLQTMVSGALLHDVGKIRVEDEILHKPGALTSQEWQEMKRHVTYGEEELGRIPEIAQEILDICAQHHERLDGSGYPRGLEESQIPLHSRMASVADVYDAITADRVYHRGMPPSTALKKMLDWSAERHLDKGLVYQFIRCLSVYPPGAVVLLSNNRLAVVETVNPEKMNKPIVQVVYNLSKRITIPSYPLDLAAKGTEVTIERAIDPEQIGLSAPELIRKGVEN